ncbi:MAG: uracil-DNA glycosylase family protein [Myxococcota bacterium]
MSDELAPLTFAPPTTHVYNPLEYARVPHEKYLRQFEGPREILMLGMNPGPWGMAQTGVPFGEVALVRDWMGIQGKVGKPAPEHPKRPIEGFSCARSEVSGARLWGWAKETFGEAEAFFSRFYVANYCPLVFMEESGKNRTPDKLPADERAPLEAICDEALRRTIDVMMPSLLIGVGQFAEVRLKKVAGDRRVGRILHPSPASPAANRGWAAAAVKDFAKLGVTF